MPYPSRPVDKPGGDSPRGPNTRLKSKDGKAAGVYAGPLGEKSKLASVHQGKGSVFVNSIYLILISDFEDTSPLWRGWVNL